MAQQRPDSLPEQPNYPAPPPPVAHNQQSTPENRGGRSGCFWGIAGLMGCLAVPVVILLVLLLAGTVSVNGILGAVGGIFGGRPTGAQIISTQTILTGIQPMGQLVSISAQLAKADIYVGIEQGALNACGFGANHVAQGTVEAGIELSNISETDIAYNTLTDTYTITLPSAQLTSCRVDFIRQYDRTTTACAVDWDEARLLANYQSLVEFREDAIEGGVRDRAEREARLVLGNFIQLLTGSKVEITFDPARSTQLPTSCQPDVPQGWTYSQTNGTWSKPS